jgi:hypothetical protein
MIGIMRCLDLVTDMRGGENICREDSHVVVTRDQERLDEGGNGRCTENFGGDRPILSREILDITCRSESWVISSN